MSRTYRRTSFNKKQNSKRMNRYWQYHSESKVIDFYEHCLKEVETGKREAVYEPAFPYRYHSDNYYSKDNRRKKVFVKTMNSKIRWDAKKAINHFILGVKDDVYLAIKPVNITRIID